MAKADIKSPSLQDTIEVTVDGEKRELFMSFGLLNELTSIIEDPARIAAVPVNIELRTAVLTSVLAKRKKSGKIEEEIDDFDDLDISIADVERLIEWSTEHVMGFFVRSLRKVTGLLDKHEGDLTALVQSLAGSANSALKSP